LSDNALSVYGAQYTAKKAFFNILGASFRIYAPDGSLRFYVKQKAFKLKEEITVFADEAATRPMLTIKARQILDWAATYDIHDATSGEKVGAMKRDGVMSSLFRDKWTILGDGDRQIGEVLEDSGALALLRRFLSNLIPETFHVSVGGKEVGHIRQSFNPFILTYQVDFAQSGSLLDPRMGVAMVVLLLAIEGRQESHKRDRPQNKRR
jgi:uncharacterized protein YxjI